jgi:predicted Rossmann-fold nucleotide-binding protein
MFVQKRYIEPVKSINFGQNKLFPQVPELNEKYKQPEIREKTITILGSSKTTPDIQKFITVCREIVTKLIKNGFNILTGAGNDGILGAAFDTAKQHSQKDPYTGKPLQNLAILREPGWGDENLEECIPIGKAHSEIERSEKFNQTSDTTIIFPGRSSTLLEVTALIQKNDYTEENVPLKKIILVGRDFFKGLHQQYNQLASSGLLRHRPEELYRLVDDSKELFEILEQKEPV